MWFALHYGQVGSRGYSFLDTCRLAAMARWMTFSREQFYCDRRCLLHDLISISLFTIRAPASPHINSRPMIAPLCLNVTRIDTPAGGFLRRMISALRSNVVDYHILRI